MRYVSVKLQDRCQFYIHLCMHLSILHTTRLIKWWNADALLLFKKVFVFDKIQSSFEHVIQIQAPFKKLPDIFEKSYKWYDLVVILFGVKMFCSNINFYLFINYTFLFNSYLVFQSNSYLSNWYFLNNKSNEFFFG